VSKRLFERVGVLACVSAALMVGSHPVAAEVSVWTLKSTIQQVLEVAPEKKAAEAEVKVRRAGVAQAGLWENPTIELGASNSMGKDDGAGGTDLNQFSISQPLPLSGRLGQQRKQAHASVKQAEADASLQSLLLEHEAARVFHRLQLSRAQLSAMEERLQSADEFQRIGQRREQAGDLSRLERLRLDLVRESARQGVASAEGKFSEALSDFQVLLGLAEAPSQLALLAGFPSLPPLAHLASQQHVHPALVAARQGVEAARHTVALARANRFSDPEIWLARERDVLGDRRQNVTAFGVSVTVPLWNRGKGGIDAAQANRQKAQLEVDALQRRLDNRLKLNHLHLAHLIKQGEQYRAHILLPAEEVFQLSRKGFAAGQVEILNLVDAVNTYFDARVQYLELLQEAWLEAAALRRAAGYSLLTHKGTAQ